MIKELIRRLQSQGEETRQEALADLKGRSGKRRKFSADEGVELLRATTLGYPKVTHGLWDIPTWIIAIINDEPRIEYLPVLKEIFPRLGPTAKERALDILSGINDESAAKAFVSLLKQYADDITTSMPLARLRRQPHQPDSFYPELLEIVMHPRFGSSILLVTLAFCEKGLMPVAKLKGHLASLLSTYQMEYEWLIHRQAEEGIGWMWAEDYQEHRNKAALLLDLFGHLPLPEIESVLHQGLAYSDPRLLYFALSSLLKHGKMPPVEAVERVAASPEMRNWLYKGLMDSNTKKLFPKKYLTQEAFAESEMVRWLVHPNELGRAPDEIELKKVVTADKRGSDRKMDYFVFRFRTYEPHWAAKDGWMAGVAGPFLRKDAPSPVAYGGTFSKFEKWDTKNPEVHLADIQKILAGQREQQM